jgi:hypothetical protein
MPDADRKKISEGRKRRKQLLGYINSPETRRRMSEARKGKAPWNKGKKLPQFSGVNSPKFGRPLSENIRHRISATLMGRVMPQETRRKISNALSGRTDLNQGRRLSAETKRKIGEAHRGAIFTPERRRRISLALRGPNNASWIPDRSKLAPRHDRDLVAYAEWRMAVYQRDHFTCRIADSHCSGRIEAHHILPWRDYPDLRFAVNNGITLCHFHHPLKRSEEARLSTLFQQLVSTPVL